MDIGTVRLVALREIWERLRSKSFLASTALSGLLIIGLAIIPGLVADDGPTTYDVGVVGASATELSDAIDEAAASLPDVADVEVDVTAYDDEAAARAALEDGDADAVVVDTTVVVEEDLPDTLATVLQLAQAGDALVPLDLEAIDPPDENADERETLVFLATVLLYGQLVGFGYWVATGIVEEKTSRVVEVLLAKAGARDLVTGKIIGIGVLGFVQLIGFVLLGLGTAWAVGTIDLPASTLRIGAEVLLWFVPGYAFYSAVFGVGGALASRPEELQNTTGPAMVMTVASFFAAIAAAGDPSGAIARITTFLPPTAPLVLPIRSAAGELAVWEAVVSLGIVLASIVVVLQLAARAYGGAALHTRGVLKLRQALRQEA
jgi:ABC-2 type transport system permease protein